MYARTTTVRGDPQRLDEGIANVRDEVLPAVQKMSGCVGLSMLADRETGRCIVTTAWADEGAMRATAESVKGLRERAAHIFGAQPQVEEWEISLLHRVRESPEGACVRVIWGRGDPARMEESLQYMRGLLPRMEDLRGFCAVSCLVDRTTGLSATAATYESREALRHAAEQGRALREELSRASGLEVTEVAEFDLVLAHLRVPETV